ncbi:hypothetical protein [Paradevosia shaoguanensis]|uniref:hypothetical protein n=1 Tax=Paradevosia shaoguanensis TaxID=1335043 RepID=UPI003C7582CF
MGTSFSNQLDKLRLTPQQAAAIKASFDRIPNDVNGALRKADVGKWRTSVLGHFSAIETKATGLTAVLGKLAGSGDGNPQGGGSRPDRAHVGARRRQGRIDNGQDHEGSRYPGPERLGPEGIANVVAMIDGLVRAAQVEGEDFDPGAIVDFARRAKTAGAGWSTDFIANYASAIMQDLGGPAAGTALASAFKSFVLGDNQINGKVYRQRQYELGIRDRKTDEIVGAELFTTNPFLWTQQYLIPALQKAGIDTSDDGAVARAVGKLSGSSTATAQLTRFIQQQDQMLKSMGLYQRAGARWGRQNQSQGSLRRLGRVSELLREPIGRAGGTHQHNRSCARHDDLGHQRSFYRCP